MGGRKRRPEANLITELLKLKPADRVRRLKRCGLEESETWDAAWRAWAHDGQKPPPGDWRVWVVMAGRGFGKTFAGANWIADAMRADGSLRVALVAATIDEARTVMVEGKSGLLSMVGDDLADWHPTRRRLSLKNGAEAALFSGASPEKLRGPEHHLAWCDELAKWEHPGMTWDMLQMGLRLGAHPRAVVTTTPRPGPVLRRIMKEPGCETTRGRTIQNPHVARAFQDTMRRLYGGTRLGRQELDGELLPEGGALWSVETLERARLLPSREEEEPGMRSADHEAVNRSSCPPPAPPAGGRGEGWIRTVIGVDPPSGDGTCGIVACAVDEVGVGHVLADHSVAERSPEGWARAVADAAEIHGTRVVVAERNQGGKMVKAVLHAADRTLDVRLVNAREGKAARAEPVALLFEAGRVRLRQPFPELEAELLGLISGAPYQGPGSSPDRADAMVWALTELMLGRRTEPGVRGL